MHPSWNIKSCLILVKTKLLISTLKKKVNHLSPFFQIYLILQVYKNRFFLISICLFTQRKDIWIVVSVRDNLILIHANQMGIEPKYM